MKWMTLFGMLCFLCACQTTESAVDLQIENQNSHLDVEFETIETGDWDGQQGFFITISVTSVMEQYQADEFSYALDSLLTDENGATYEALHSETLPLENETEQVKVRQFYTPELPDDLSHLDITVFAKPLYYKRELVIPEMTDGTTNRFVNDLLINKAETDGRRLMIEISDIQPISGLSLSLIQDNEEIYPVFSTTNYLEDTNQLIASYDFATPLPDLFTLKLTRLHLEEQIWKLPLTIPVG
ncbi:hypothetical protein M3202_13815 [Alkalihalobacillus oceani]|uniref:Uncharacterized protein n=1 Tax=Halalkalibacter oceani TaxID=1653776 RepID=A0A9X2IPS9_9BACI|nr:hypothetical protein [Halalkalibacter oceani]MCM3715161.1 hypothetical protein [Halalkalibacter oceani]